MVKNKFDALKVDARNTAIQKVKKQLKQEKDYYKLKKLEKIIKNGEI